MRILKLQFTNLNSLAGTWHIDFTHPAYAHGGIFAITGPTGAGKSTILDAICLALYGCTPRLKSISATENEIMSRLTAVCSAEVTFQTQAGTYRCTWSQNRARKKSDGKLQQPVHEIVDAATGKVLESQIKKVAAKIIDVTGMDFAQFTRSMLLAQGSFATFLQASANERGPVLEQITGTEIYSNISIYVFERRRAEETSLREIEIELGGMQTMSEEELNALRADLAGLKTRVADLKLKTEELRIVLAWHDAVAALEDARERAESDYEEHLARSAAAEPLRVKLGRAERASLLARYYEPVKRLRTEERQLAEKIGSAEEKRPGMQRSRDEAERRLADAHRMLEESRSSLQRDAAQWKEVRMLDTRIAELRKRAGEALRRQHDVRMGQERYNRILAEQSALRAGYGSESEILRQFFEHNASDASLSGSLGAITLMADGVKAAEEKLVRSVADVEALKKERDAAGVERDGEQRACTANTGAAASALKRAAESDARLEAILNGEDIAAYRSTQATLIDREKKLDELVRMTGELTAGQSALRTLEEEKKELAARLDKGREYLTAAEDDERTKQREVDHCHETLMLVSAIETLTEQRAHLQDGVPCPLCGSPDHPFAHGQIPAADEKREAFERAKRELKAASDKLKRYSEELVKIDESIRNVDAKLLERSAQIGTVRSTLEAGCAALELACDDAVIPAEAARVRAERARVEQIAAAADEALNDQHRAHKESERMQRESHEAQLRYEKASARFAQAEHACLQREQDCALVSRELDVMLQKLNAAIAPYGVAPVTAASADEMIDGLRRRKDEWEARLKEQESLQQLDDGAVSEIKAAEAVLSDLALQAVKTDEDARACGAECGTAESVRRELYGDKDPDEDERRRNEEIAALDRSIPPHQQEAERRRRELAELEKETEMFTERLGQCGIERKAAEAALNRELAASGFADEEELTAAQIADEELNRLKAQIDALRDEGTRLDSLRVEKRKQLEAELDKQLSHGDRASAAHALAETENEGAAALHTAGAYEDRLSQNEAQQSQRAEKFKAREQRLREYTRWDALNELIGSANGKKFQKIAQAITFEMMVAQANAVLKKMSPRYFLVCDRNVELEMNIVDAYQAGEIRSTKNLSGGESFIVSLSLALGLSHMASRNVRVDSLFLDEGFGTLDEDALDIALSTLGELQQEGKSIGVISHVGALKERIATQIVVTPDSGGRSQLNGPGCRRIT